MMTEKSKESMLSQVPQVGLESWLVNVVQTPEKLL